MFYVYVYADCDYFIADSTTARIMPYYWELAFSSSSLDECLEFVERFEEK